MLSKTRLWETARPTDPAFTKEFKRAKGFKGTSTNATYMIRRATETFGPVGIGFGWTIIDEKYVTGGQIAEGTNAVIHVCRIRLWYIYEEKRGEFEHIGQTTFIGSDKNGIYTDEEAPKKSLTDAITKALSCLGFAAEIYLGLWDDNKYVSSVRTEFHAEGNGKDTRYPALSMDMIGDVTASLELAPTFAALTDMVRGEAQKMAQRRDSDGRARLLKAASEIATRKFPKEYAASKTPAKGKANVDSSAD